MTMTHTASQRPTRRVSQPALRARAHARSRSNASIVKAELQSGYANCKAICRTLRPRVARHATFYALAHLSPRNSIRGFSSHSHAHDERTSAQGAGGPGGCSIFPSGHSTPPNRLTGRCIPTAKWTLPWRMRLHERGCAARTERARAGPRFLFVDLLLSSAQVSRISIGPNAHALCLTTICDQFAIFAGGYGSFCDQGLFGFCNKRKHFGDAKSFDVFCTAIIEGIALGFWFAAVLQAGFAGFFHRFHQGPISVGISRIASLGPS